MGLFKKKKWYDFKNLDWQKLFISIVCCQFVGIIGAFFTTPYIASWYATLIKPTWGPPNWLFGPVWTLLFLLMGISYYLIWMKSYKKAKEEMHVFIFHLVLNILWSVIFFTLQEPLFAFIEMILLWVLIIVVMVRFEKINKVAAYLLLPYFFWVSFAMILNFTIWRLNS